MIRRNSSKYTVNQENLNQSSFTGMKGIDFSKAPTSPDTLLDCENLDIDYDGGLILRKPLVKKFNGVSGFFKRFEDYFLRFFKTEDGLGYNIDVVFRNSSETIRKELRLQFEYDREEDCTTKGLAYCIDILQILSTVSTPTSVLVACEIRPYMRWYDVADGTYVKEHIPHTNFVEDEDLDNSTYFRYIKFTLQNENEYVLAEILSPDATEVENTDIPLNFNLYSDLDTAVIDSYNEGYNSVNAIVMYENYLINYDTTVKKLTQSSNSKIINAFNKEYSGVSHHLWLKAFINIHHTPDLYGCWEYSVDGVSWNTLKPYFDQSGLDFIPSIVAYELDTVSDSLTGANALYKPVEGYSMCNIKKINTDGSLEIYPYQYSNESLLKHRIDCVKISTNTPPPGVYRFRMFVTEEVERKQGNGFAYNVTLETKTVTEDSPYSKKGYFKYTEDEYTSTKYELEEVIQSTAVGTNSYEVVVQTTYYSCIKANIISSKEYTPVFDKYEVVEDLPELSFKNTLYYKKRMYSFSKDTGNIITVSNTNSTYTPISDVIDLDTFANNSITSLTPWRDYLVATTTSSIHLLIPQEIGFTSKTVNTFIGIPEKDGRTCVAIMNGILFKSEDKIYTLHPDFSSGNETILNISDISKPVQHLLGSGHPDFANFAFTTSTTYYLFIPQENGTTMCLKYDFTRRIWSKHIYNAIFTDYEFVGDSIEIHAIYKDMLYVYDFESDISTEDAYADIMNDVDTLPIKFFVDSGQKIDNISLTKQFVESKIIVATLESKDNFKMDVRIDIEGNTFVKHVDLNTDGALLRDSSSQILTLGSSANLTDDEDTFNTMRQMFLRYSGKGKTIRHIISGESLHKFKIYETFYRYKILNVKQ